MSKEITVDGLVCAPKEQQDMSGTVLIRSRDAGVFWGNLVSREGDSVVLKNSRRIWYWDGAATLSELAMKGTSKPDQCKFPAVIAGDHMILGVCEVIPVSETAAKSLMKVKVWSAC